MANQYEADPRQLDFLRYYLDPKQSDTYSNIYQSAVKAGYSEEYAKVINSQVDWLSENLRRATKTKLVNKAVNNLDELLDSKDEKVKADMTKFALKTDVEFSEKREEKIILPTPLLGASSVQTDDSNQEATEA